MNKVISALTRHCDEALLRASHEFQEIITARDQGSMTAEYVIVLVAATGFAGILLLVLKSDAIKNILSEMVKNALQAG